MDPETVMFQTKIDWNNLTYIYKTNFYFIFGIFIVFLNNQSQGTNVLFLSGQLHRA